MKPLQGLQILRNTNTPRILHHGPMSNEAVHARPSCQSSPWAFRQARALNLDRHPTWWNLGNQWQSPTSQPAPLGRKFQAKQKLLGEILDQENLDYLNFGDEHIKRQFKQNLHSLGFCTWPLQPLQFLVFHLLSCSFLSCFVWVAKEILVIAQRPDNNLGPRFHGSPGQMANIEFVGKAPGRLSSPVSTGECNYCMDEWWKTMKNWYDQILWAHGMIKENFAKPSRGHKGLVGCDLL